MRSASSRRWKGTTVASSRRWTCCRKGVTFASSRGQKRTTLATSRRGGKDDSCKLKEVEKETIFKLKTVDVLPERCDVCKLKGAEKDDTCQLKEEMEKDDGCKLKTVDVLQKRATLPSSRRGKRMTLAS